MNKKNNIVEVFSGDLYQATMVKDLLEASGIEVFIENKLMSVIEPWIVSPGGIAPVNVKIFCSDYTKAQELIAAFTKREWAFLEEDKPYFLWKP
jgi:Putative prokaryotic signal transducing protein